MIPAAEQTASNRSDLDTSEPNHAGEGDVLWRKVGAKLRFDGINYYDGQGFTVSRGHSLRNSTTTNWVNRIKMNCLSVDWA